MIHELCCVATEEGATETKPDETTESNADDTDLREAPAANEDDSSSVR